MTMTMSVKESFKIFYASATYFLLVAFHRSLYFMHMFMNVIRRSLSFTSVVNWLKCVFTYAFQSFFGEYL